MEAVCTGHALTRLLQQWEPPHAPPSPQSLHRNLQATGGEDGLMAGPIPPAPRRLRLAVIWQPDSHMRHAQYWHIFQTLYVPLHAERSGWQAGHGGSKGGSDSESSIGGKEEGAGYAGLEPVAVYHQQPEWLDSSAYKAQVRTGVRAFWQLLGGGDSFQKK